MREADKTTMVCRLETMAQRQVSSTSTSPRCSQWKISTLPNSATTDHAQGLSDLTVTADMVRSKLKGLKSTSSPGPDRIHPRVLTEAADQLAEPLTII